MRKWYSRLSVLLCIVFSCTVLCACSELFPFLRPNKPEEVTVVISQTTCEITVGDTCELYAAASDGSDVDWLSADENIAIVMGGVVTGRTPGKTAVYAYCDNALATCEVTVKAAAGTLPPDDDKKPDDENKDNEKPDNTTVTVAISQSKLSLEVGDTYQLTAVASDGSAVSWRSLNYAIATVSNGTVTARGEGKANILAISGSANAVCEVTVTPSSNPQPVIPAPSGYTLVWNDEFDGNSLDMSKWSYQVGTRDVYNGAYGPNDWGNDELQYYTDGANVTVSGGELKITAKKEQKGGKSYTSARIVTRDKSNAQWTYGYFEARMKTPTGSGMWPAFWMLPQPNGSNGMNNEYGGWASSGEIDIMEAKGRLNNKVDTTLHFGNANQSTYRSGTTTLSSNTDEWHTYALEWTSSYMDWIVDGNRVMSVRPVKYESNGWWSQVGQSQGNNIAPFDKPFYILFDLAVGGRYDSYNSPDMSTFTSATMYVDYVRVFQKK